MTSITNSANEVGDVKTIQKIYQITKDKNIWSGVGSQQTAYIDTTG